MIKLKKHKTKRLVAIHGWSGVILGLILYVVIVTGAVAVFAHEIGRWSAGGLASANPLSQGIHASMVEFARAVNPAYLEEVSLFENSAGHLVAFFHHHATNPASGKLDDKGVMIEFDPPANKIILRREGYGSELFGTDPLSALDSFIVDLHINLYLPGPWGLYATGILGLLLLVAAVSGLLIHRHLAKEIFMPPRYSNAVVNRKDRHVLAASWSLPFAFVLAFTGAFFSFAISLGLPIAAKSAYGGDQIAMREALVGRPAAKDDTPADITNLDKVLADSAARAGSLPTAMTISHWGRADATAVVHHPNPDGSIQRQSNAYNMVNAAFQRVKPRIGAAPSTGSMLFNLMGVLHFGHFAGLLSKIIWFSLGIAMAYVTLTGLHLWLERRSDSVLWQRFAAATTITGYGLNIALAGAALGFFISLPGATTQFWTPAGFVLGALVSIVAGCLLRAQPLRRKVLHLLLGIALLLIPAVRIGMGGAIGDPIVAMLDLALLCGAGWIFAVALFGRGRLPDRAVDSAAMPAQ